MKRGMNVNFLFYIGLCLTLVACDACNEPEPEALAEIRWANDITVFETEATSSLSFQVRISEAKSENIAVDFETIDGTAVAGEDYTATSGTLVFAPGEITKTVEVQIVVDDYLEPDEQFTMLLSNPVNGYVKVGEPSVIGGIRNDDNMVNISDAGYQAADSYEGMTLTWSDEFAENSINYDNWGYDLGTGNGGWGNNELQNYTSSPNNSYVSDGRLIIKAEKVGENAYTSARMKSLGLQEFQYGRVDMRALIPKGQGIWPALWMLGANYSQVGWPACGEIDIMELLGHQPGSIHGTAHWGNDYPQWQHQGDNISIYPDTFNDEFNVFSIDWSPNEINYLMNDELFFTINTSMMNGQNYPFNNPFFFIMNVAVGGNWPGYPNESTSFPVFMAVDYVRVYQ